MSDFSDKTVLVVDNGKFLELAVALAEAFGRTYLYVPWDDSMPKSNELLIGEGLAGVKRVKSIWEVLDQVDLFVFPDIGFGQLQEHLVSLGKRVWGARTGERLELDREYARREFIKQGLAVPPHTVVVGMEQLRAYLKEHDDQYVKLSLTRGDFETFHAPNYQYIEPRLDDIEERLGPKKRLMRFLVEQPIPDAVELAYDGYSIDGKFPARSMVGLEVKDRGYVGCMQTTADLADALTEVNEGAAPILARSQYRNFWACETRITKDGTPWVIDPCCRMGSPPGELLLLQYTNLAEILWHGADGEVVDPEAAGKWGAAAMLSSSWVEHHWQPIQFPEKIRKHVKLQFCCKLNDEYYVIPQPSTISMLGAVVATGDTMAEAIKEVQRLAKEVEGYCVECAAESLDEADKTLDGLSEYGLSLVAST